MNVTMTKSVSFTLAAAVLVGVIMAGCGAHSPRLLVERYKTIHIGVVENKTYETALEEQFTRDLIKIFKRDGRLRLVPKPDADLCMTATITNARVYPLAYSDLDRAVGYSLDVTMAVSVKDAEGAALVVNRPFFGTGVQMITEDPSAGGVQNVSERIAYDVLSYLVEGW